MKRILSAICMILSFLLPLSACNRQTPSVTSTGTTWNAVGNAPLSSMIVRPPTRSANTQYPANAYQCWLSLGELWERAEAVAWVSIGNWLSESDYGSYYDATVVKCYKGDLSPSIVLEQAGSSIQSYTDFPLFIYGNEFLVFLQNWDADALSAAGPYGGVDDLPIFRPGDPDVEYPEVTPDDEPDHITGEDQVMPIPEVDDETDSFLSGPIFTIPPEFTDIIVVEPQIMPVPAPQPDPEQPYENCYQILGNSALMDCATGIDGNVYLLDRYYLVEPSMGLTAPTHRPAAEIAEDVLQLLSGRDMYSYRLFKGRILYRLSDLLEYLENPPPETEDE